MHNLVDKGCVKESLRSAFLAAAQPIPSNFCTVHQTTQSTSYRHLLNPFETRVTPTFVQWHALVNFSGQ